MVVFLRVWTATTCVNDVRQRAQDLSEPQDRGNLHRAGDYIRQDSAPRGCRHFSSFCHSEWPRTSPVGSLKLPEDKLKIIMPPGIDVARGSMLNVQDTLGNYSLTDHSNFQNSIGIFLQASVVSRKSTGKTLLTSQQSPLARTTGMHCGDWFKITFIFITSFISWSSAGPRSCRFLPMPLVAPATYAGQTPRKVRTLPDNCSLLYSSRSTELTSNPKAWKEFHRWINLFQRKI